MEKETGYLTATSQAIKDAFEEEEKVVKANPLMSYDSANLKLIAELVPNIALNLGVIAEMLSSLTKLMVATGEEEANED